MNGSKENAILQVAEDMVRKGGYNSFSFRKVADKVGIKSASVHYHFPTKGELAVAVAKRYTDKFINAIGQPEDIHKSGQCPIVVYISAFRSALTQDQGLCLGGMLSAEAASLPQPVIEATKVFFARNVEWLERAYQCIGIQEEAKNKAMQTVSLLEGAMIISNVMDDNAFFDAAEKMLK